MSLGSMLAPAGRLQAAHTPAPPAVAAGGPAAGRQLRQPQLQRRRHGLNLGPGPQRRPQRPGAAAVEAPAGIQIENIVYEDGCFSVQGCLVSPACPDTIFEVLTDYDALPRVFHNVDTSSVRHDPLSGQKQLVQTCKWAFLVFSGTFVTELNVREDPAKGHLTFSLIESAFMKEFVGSWEVRQAATGLTEVRHRLSVRPAVAPPQKIGELTCRIFRKQVVGILDDLQQELENRLR